MKLGRRRFLHLAAGATVLPAIPRSVRAETYPSRPVRLVVPFPPGQGVDIIGRLVAQRLSERLGQPFVVENKPGGGGNIGVEAVVRAPADGYTLLAVTVTDAINATLYPNLNFDFIRDIAPVAGIFRSVQVMEVNLSVPAQTVPEFIAYARANPGKLNMASAGNGNITHVSGELFKMMAGVDMLHVPYRGSAPALTDLLGDKVQVMFDNLISSVELVRSGKLRALAVTTKTRSQILPDMPTIGEFLPGYEGGGWGGFAAPKNTPPEIVDILNREVNAALADPTIEARLVDLGTTVLKISPADFTKLIANDKEKWASVIRSAKIKVE